MMELKLTECSVLHLCATNDTNGNPRRLFALVHAPTGRIVAIEDEGYCGREAIDAIVKRCKCNAPKVAIEYLYMAVCRVPTVPTFRRELLNSTYMKELTLVV